MTARTVVTNPGGLQWQLQAAASLARRGMLAKYCAPVSVTARGESVPAWARWVLRGGKAKEALRRRVLPSVIASSQTSAAATLPELTYVGAQRVPLPRPVQAALLNYRDNVFARATPGLLPAEATSLVANAGTALEGFAAITKRGGQSVLIQPTAHHRFVRELMQEEAELVPSYANTLQGHEKSPSHLLRLDEEIAAASNVVVLSDFQADTFAECGVPRERLSVVNLGVDLELFKPSSRLRQPGPFRVLFVGQITQRKGISYLIDGFRLADIPNSELLLVGRPVGPKRPWSGARGVKHIPHVDRWTLPSQYHAADVFVLPSLIEGFPQTALEAMACGVAPILSNHTFTSDVIEDGTNGLIVPIRDADAIAACLRKLWQHEGLRIEIGRRAAETASAYSWDRFGSAIVDLIQDA